MTDHIAVVFHIRQHQCFVALEILAYVQISQLRVQRCQGGFGSDKLALSFSLLLELLLEVSTSRSPLLPRLGLPLRLAREHQLLLLQQVRAHGNDSFGWRRRGGAQGRRATAVGFGGRLRNDCLETGGQRPTYFAVARMHKIHQARDRVYPR